MTNEIAIKDKDRAFAVAEALLEEDYVVMISREEQLYIINYIWSDTCDRNDVVFINREEYEEQIIKEVE